MFSFVGDTVLDPFLGTGTTTEAAIRANRSSIGYEVERKYFDIVKRRFAQLRSEATVRFD
jgi:site-specific DNA-methyltransferase (adenine-specific)